MSLTPENSAAVKIKYEEKLKCLKSLAEYLNTKYEKLQITLNQITNEIDFLQEIEEVCQVANEKISFVNKFVINSKNQILLESEQELNKNEENCKKQNNVDSIIEDKEDSVVKNLHKNQELKTETFANSNEETQILNNDKVQNQNLEKVTIEMNENPQTNLVESNKNIQPEESKEETQNDSEKENLNKNLKQKIRLVALDKLLDPKIIAATSSYVSKQNQSIIVLDESDDEEKRTNKEYEKENFQQKKSVDKSNSEIKKLHKNKQMAGKNDEDKNLDFQSNRKTTNQDVVNNDDDSNIVNIDKDNGQNCNNECDEIALKDSTKNQDKSHIEKNRSDNSENNISSKKSNTTEARSSIIEHKCKKKCLVKIQKSYVIEKMLSNSKKSISINKSNVKRPLGTKYTLKEDDDAREKLEDSKTRKKRKLINDFFAPISSQLNKRKKLKRITIMSDSDISDDNLITENQENVEEIDSSWSEETENKNSIGDAEFKAMGGLKYKISLKSNTNSKLQSNQSDEDESNNEEQSHGENSSSGSEIIKKRSKSSKANNKKKENDNGDGNSSEGSSSEEEEGKTKKHRKRIRAASHSDSGSETNSPNKKRKNIRKLIKKKDLDSETKTAARQEQERRKRIEERQKLYNEFYETPQGVELNELVLDFNEETKQTLLKVDAGLLKQLKPHQASGVKFMWEACFETIKYAKEKPGSGCILGHCMGLGKTLQVVTLVHTLLTNNKKTNVEKVLVIAPLSTLNNWAREFLQWTKFCKNKNLEIYDMSKWKDKKTRIFKLNEWFEEGGVCILGYDMFRILSSPTQKNKKQREKLQNCLINPGPDLVVCDEGHLLKNEKTSLSKAVNKLKTLRRIVLTGTPLQNNLKEYYCMIQFVKPNLLGTYKEYMNRFVNPITNGQYTDSTEYDISLMKKRSHVLHTLLKGCIQRKDYSVLAPYLPNKYEYVLFIQLTELQQKLYETYMTIQKDLIADPSGKGAKLFQDFCNLRRIWTHPLALKMDAESSYKKRLKEAISTDEEGSLKDFIDDNDASPISSDSESESFNSEESLTNRNTNSLVRRTRQNADQFKEEDIHLNNPADELPQEWWSSEVSEEALYNINESPKLLLLLHILQECEKIGDKVLVFSQSLQSLDIIEHFLYLIDRKTQGENIENGNVGNNMGSWTQGLDYFRLDGSRTVDNRDAMCKVFNDPNNLRARLFLISTRAGGLGINLVAANRVIIFDVSWNPSHDTQSIFRVYRFGQIKPCYIYRFIALGTMEEKIYERQVTKQATAKRVLDEQQISRHYNQNDLLELYKYEVKPTKPRETPILPKDRLFADVLSQFEKLVYRYHEHDSLLENEENENLTEEERKNAWDEYEAEKNRPAYQPYIRTNYVGTNGPVTSNKLFGFRSDVLLQCLNMKVSQDHPHLSLNACYEKVPLYMQRLYNEIGNEQKTLYNELVYIAQTLQFPPNSYMNYGMQPAMGIMGGLQQHNPGVRGGNINYAVSGDAGGPGSSGDHYYQQLHQQQDRFIAQQQMRRGYQRAPQNSLPSTSSTEVYEID